MRRFVFEFEGMAELTAEEFFAENVPETIGLDEISNEVEYVSVFDLLNDWNLADSLSVTLTDTETGAVWENTNGVWQLISTRRLLPGEQRLF